MVRQLPPWHESLQKRQVKAPKVYVRDTGLLHQLLGLRTGQERVAHPKCGASWEGYAIEETLKLLQPDEATPIVLIVTRHESGRRAFLDTDLASVAIPSGY